MNRIPTYWCSWFAHTYWYPWFIPKSIGINGFIPGIGINGFIPLFIDVDGLSTIGIVVSPCRGVALNASTRPNQNGGYQSGTDRTGETNRKLTDRIPIRNRPIRKNQSGTDRAKPIRPTNRNRRKPIRNRPETNPEPTGIPIRKQPEKQIPDATDETTDELIDENCLEASNVSWSIILSIINIPWVWFGITINSPNKTKGKCIGISNQNCSMPIFQFHSIALCGGRLICQKMFSVFCADSDEIRSVISVIPIFQTRGGNAVFIFKFIRHRNFLKYQSFVL